MHGSRDKSGKNENSIRQRWGLGFLALPALLAIALFVLAIGQPATSNWISEAVQAELSGISMTPEEASEHVPPIPADAARHASMV